MEVKLWDTSSGVCRAALSGHSKSVTVVVWSPDGKTLASGSHDNTIVLWDASSGASRPLRGHTDSVSSVAWSPDGKTVASGSKDNTIKLWDFVFGSATPVVQATPAVTSLSFVHPLAPSAASGLCPSGPKVALCIGIASYETPLNTLVNPVHDAGDVAAALTLVGYDTITLFDRAATKKGMRQALESFSSRLGRGGVAFFFFAGHGMTGLDGKNYLLPVNGVDYIEDLEDDALSLEAVNKQLDGSGCFLHVVVADACRSLPSLRSRKRTAMQPRGLSVCSAAPAEIGSLLAYSCDLGKTAADGNGRNGAFTSALLRHLTTPGLHVENVFTRAARDCQELTKHEPEPQKPWKSANLTHEHVCLF